MAKRKLGSSLPARKNTIVGLGGGCQTCAARRFAEAHLASSRPTGYPGGDEPFTGFMQAVMQEHLVVYQFAANSLVGFTAIPLAEVDNIFATNQRVIADYLTAKADSAAKADAAAVGAARADAEAAERAALAAAIAGEDGTDA